MILTQSLVKFVLRAGAKHNAPRLFKAAEKYEINNELRLAHWLGQMHQESLGFTFRVENLNYSIDGLLSTFGRHRITKAQCEAYGYIKGKRAANKEAIANTVYGGDWGRENLGNVLPGDGFKFIGRSDKQVTGRYNYGVTSIRMYGDARLLGTPSIIEQDEPSAMVAGCFWDWKELNAVAETNDVAAVTLIVNGGDKGLRERIQFTEEYLQRIRNAPEFKPFANVVSSVTSTEDIKGPE